MNELPINCHFFLEKIFFLISFLVESSLFSIGFFSIALYVLSFIVKSEYLEQLKDYSKNSAILISILGLAYLVLNYELIYTFIVSLYSSSFYEQFAFYQKGFVNSVTLTLIYLSVKLNFLIFIISQLFWIKAIRKSYLFILVISIVISLVYNFEAFIELYVLKKMSNEFFPGRFISTELESINSFVGFFVNYCLPLIMFSIIVIVFTNAKIKLMIKK